MPIDSSIYARYAQPVKSVGDFQSEADARDRNQLAVMLGRQNLEQGQMDMQRARQQHEQQNALMQFRRGLDPSIGDAARVNAYKGAGYFDEADKLQGTLLKQSETEANIETKRATARSSDYAIAEKGFNAYKAAAGRLRGVPNLSREMVLGVVGELVTARLMPLETAQALTQNLPSDPRQLAEAIEMEFRSQLTPEQLLNAFAPKPTQIDNGQQIGFRDTNPNSPTYGQMTAGAVTQKMATPGDVLQADTATANNKRSVGASMANAAATRSVAASNVEAARIAAGAKNETDLRKEFADLPETKKFKNAVPAFNAIVKASKTNNPQADINLVYGVAKLYDPDSVVREGEYATIANSQAIPERIKGWAKSLAGGGKLTEETKRQILEQAQIRLDSYKNEYDASAGAYGDIVRKRGLDPTNVLTPVGSSVERLPPPADNARRKSGAVDGGLSAAEQAELQALRRQLGKK